VVQTWDVVCGAPLTGSVVEVDGIAASRANVILRLALADGRVLNSVLTADRSSFMVPARERPGEVVRSYLTLGVEHILTGLDHLLFVLGLMLLVTNRRQLLWTVTAFTAGHSVTLSLATLGFVKVPSGPVEALIALSILVVAVEIARDTDSSLTKIQRRPWTIAFAFGLLHGFGFAGALSEIGLPEGEIPLALLSFNLGIEAGQLVFCGVALALYLAARYLPIARLLLGRRIAAYAIGSLAAFWIIERATASL
jgi:hydrogenase/urease accessory protein HupE